MKYKHQCGAPRKQMRWKDFDYSSQGVYFVTIVTYERRCLFGNIFNGEMLLSEAGKMVLEKYLSLESDTFNCMDVVVMPNHIHFMAYLPHDGSTTLPQAVHCFKSLTTKLYAIGVKEKGWLPFDGKLWQRGYWDDIVWNGRMFEFIRRYIYLNPARWEKDKINEAHASDVDHVCEILNKLKHY